MEGIIPQYGLALLKANSRVVDMWQEWHKDHRSEVLSAFRVTTQTMLITEEIVNPILDSLEAYRESRGSAKRDNKTQRTWLDRFIAELHRLINFAIPSQNHMQHRVARIPHEEYGEKYVEEIMRLMKQRAKRPNLGPYEVKEFQRYLKPAMGLMEEITPNVLSAFRKEAKARIEKEKDRVLEDTLHASSNDTSASDDANDTSASDNANDAKHITGGAFAPTHDSAGRRRELFPDDKKEAELNEFMVTLKMKSFISVEREHQIRSVTEQLSQSRFIHSNDIPTVMAAGSLISDMKALLPHGQLMLWLSVVGLPERRAGDYRRAWDRFGSTSEIWSAFEGTAMFKLASSPGASEEAMERAKNGEKITMAVAQQLLKMHRKQKDPVSPVQVEEETLPNNTAIIKAESLLGEGPPQPEMRSALFQLLALATLFANPTVSELIDKNPKIAHRHVIQLLEITNDLVSMVENAKAMADAAAE